MHLKSLIDIHTFCTNHNVELSFVRALQQNGLIEMVLVQDQPYIHEEQLFQLEKFTRMHYDLEINLEGIETIHHLLTKIDAMQREITDLKNKLRFYETLD